MFLRWRLSFLRYSWAIRIHKTLRVTPAMEAGITDRVWTMEDIVALMDARAPKPGPRRPYNKRKGERAHRFVRLPCQIRLCRILPLPL